MSPIFVDTAYLVSIINLRNQLREKALLLREEIGIRKMVVTQNVFVEALNYFAEYKSHTKQTACLIVENFLVDPDVIVIDQTPYAFHEGMLLYKSRLDQGYIA